MEQAPETTSPVEQLVHRAQRGDRLALDELFSRHFARIRRIAERRLGPALRRDLEAADIVQDCMAVALRKFPEFRMRGEGSFVRWLGTIVEHQITDRASWQHAKLRDRAREVALDASASGDQQERPVRQVADEGPSPLQAATLREARHLVVESMAALDESHRAVLLLRDYEGRTWDEIARCTGHASADAARMFHTRALELLCSCMMSRLNGAPRSASRRRGRGPVRSGPRSGLADP